MTSKASLAPNQDLEDLSVDFHADQGVGSYRVTDAMASMVEYGLNRATAGGAWYIKP